MGVKRARNSNRLPPLRMAGTHFERRKTQFDWSVPCFADSVNVIARNAARLGRYRLGYRLPYSWGGWGVSFKRVSGSEVLFCPFGYHPGGQNFHVGRHYGSVN